MTNCDWINSKLEAYFCDTLSDDERRLFETHLTSCQACGREVESLKALDPLVHGVMQRRLALAQRPAHSNSRPRVLRVAVSALTLAAVVVLLAIGMRFLQETPAPPIVGRPPEVQPVETTKKDTEQSSDPKLAKPLPADRKPLKPAPQPELDVATANGPEFAIIDAAGYTATLEMFRGRVFLFGVISSEQKAAVSNFQQVYDAFQTNRGIRMLAVARHREDEISTTIPLFFNNGSQLMGVKEGQFLLVDAMGQTSLKGSLSDPASITRLKNQLGQLGIR